MNVPRSELPHTQPPQIEELQRARDYMSEHASQREVQALDQVVRPSEHYSPFKYLDTDGIKVYGNGASLGALFAMDAIGMQPQVALDSYRLMSGGCDQAVTDTVFHGARIAMVREGYETYYTLEVVDDTKDDHFVAHLEHAIGERMLQSPAHQAISRALRKVTSQTELHTEAFDYRDDPLGTLVCFQALGLIRDMDSQIQQRVAIGLTSEHLEQVLATGRSYGVSLTEKDNQRYFRWFSQNKAVSKELIIDDTTGEAMLQVRSSAPLVYLEKANQSEARSLPFVDSECARDITGALDTVGLTFSPALQAQMIDLGDADRYGSIYTQMSREVAKWINDPARVRVSSLFALKQPETEPSYIAKRKASAGSWYLDESETQDELVLRERLLGAPNDTPMGEAAATIFALARGALLRDDSESDLPVTQDRIHITNGACFDVVAYYLGAVERIYDGYPDSLSIRDVGDVTLLKKTFGSHTYLTKDTIRFNGVNIPKGSLMHQSEDGGWAFLRLTPFTFDNPKDQLAFGSEISKALENESRAIERIGNISLEALVIIDK